MSNLKSRILSAKDVPSQLVLVPEWGGDVLVRGMNGYARDEFEARFGGAAQAAAAAKAEGKDPETAVSGAAASSFHYHLVINHVHDPETDERIFEDGDLPALKERSWDVIQRLAGIAMQLSGMVKAPVDEAGKSSSDPGETTSPTTSPTDSPESTSSGSSSPSSSEGEPPVS